MKILVISGSLSPLAGGMYFSCRIPSNLIAAKGHEVIATGLWDAQWDAFAGNWHVSRVIMTGPYERVQHIQRLRDLDRILAQENPDIVHLRGVWSVASLATLRWTKRTGKPLIISPHGMLDEAGLKISSGKKRIIRLAWELANLQQARVVHALNEQEAASIRAFGVTAPVKIIPNGVELPQLPPVPLADRKPSGKDKRRILLFLSRVHPKKGVTSLVEAWLKLVAANSAVVAEWRLVLAGFDDGNHMPALKSRIETAAAGDHIEFPGGVFGTEKERLLAEASAMILPSRSEGLPIAILEAWANRIPVFMSDACNLPVGFEAKAAVRVEDDAQQIADTLQHWLSMPVQTLDDMGHRGQQLVQERNSWPSIAHRFESLYQDCIQHKASQTLMERPESLQITHDLDGSKRRSDLKLSRVALSAQEPSVQAQRQESRGLSGVNENRPVVGILSASLSQSSGGIGPIMQNHGRLLVERGFGVKVFGISDQNLDRDRARWTPLDLSVHDPLLSKLAFAPSLSRAVLASGVDILHLHGLWLYPSIVASRWRQKTGRPLVISTQGMLEPWATARSSQIKALAHFGFESNNLRNASCLHCSASEVAGIRDHGLRQPIAVIANGMALPDMRLQRPRPEALGPENRKTLLFLGRIHPKKGLREAIDAWDLFRKSSPALCNEWQFCIAGWGEQKEQRILEAMITDKGLTGSVRFIGPWFDADKDALLRNVDAFVLPSYSEGLPMAVLEALSYGLPALLTRHCNLPDALASRAAIEISNDPVLLARQLAANLAAPDLSDYGQRARHLIEGDYNWDLIGAQLASLYDWLLTGSAPPDFIDFA